MDRIDDKVNDTEVEDSPTWQVDRNLATSPPTGQLTVSHPVTSDLMLIIIS